MTNNYEEMIRKMGTSVGSRKCEDSAQPKAAEIELKKLDVSWMVQALAFTLQYKENKEKILVSLVERPSSDKPKNK